MAWHRTNLALAGAVDSRGCTTAVFIVCDDEWSVDAFARSASRYLEAAVLNPSGIRLAN